MKTWCGGVAGVPLVVLALALVVCKADSTLQSLCERPGWVFLEKVQQQSWQAILNCDPLREPWLRCAITPECVGFTHNAATGEGFMYGLPRARRCGGLQDLSNLQWAWEWKWVPMHCKDRGPCCGTYVINDAGASAAFDLKCQQVRSSSGGSGGNLAPQWGCSSPTECPKLWATQHYVDISTAFAVDCEQQRERAFGPGGNSPNGGRRRLTAAAAATAQAPCPAAHAPLAWPHAGGGGGSSSNVDGSSSSLGSSSNVDGSSSSLGSSSNVDGSSSLQRSLRASGPSEALKRVYAVQIVKQSTELPESRQRGYIRPAGSASCKDVARTCGRLSLS